jgi:hypothetical protein
MEKILGKRRKQLPSNATWIPTSHGFGMESSPIGNSIGRKLGGLGKNLKHKPLANYHRTPVISSRANPEKVWDGQMNADDGVSR